MNWREFRSEGRKATLVWRIKQEGDTYFTQSGQLDGKMQEFKDTPGCKGKEDSKAFVSAEDNCMFNVDREIRYKMEAGYVEFINGELISDIVSDIDFKELLPTCFSSYKPNTKIEDDKLVKLHDSGNALWTLKRDGMAHIAVHHTYGWEVYTRAVEKQTEKFKWLIDQLNVISEFGPGTVLIGELQCLKNGREDFDAISKFCRSLSDTAHKLIGAGEIPEPIYMIFDMLYQNGNHMKDSTYEDRSKIWRSAVVRANPKSITLVEYVDVTPDTWEQYAEENKIEGFVVVDKTAKFSDKMFSFTGKPPRPKGSWKCKRWITEDAVAFAASMGAGKRLNGIGAIHTKQIHPVTGKWFYTGKAGTGFTDKTRAEMEERFEKLGLPIFEKDKDAEKMDIQNTDGICVELKYPERLPSGKFRFPVFKRFRDDKPISECVAQNLVNDADDE